jgi:hypothetical protein
LAPSLLTIVGYLSDASQKLGGKSCPNAFHNFVCQSPNVLHWLTHPRFVLIDGIEFYLPMMVFVSPARPARRRGTARGGRERALPPKRPAADEACRPALEFQPCVNAPPERLETNLSTRRPAAARGPPRCEPILTLSPSDKLANCRGTARKVRERTLLTKRPAADEACRPALKLQLCVNAPPEKSETSLPPNGRQRPKGLPRCAPIFTFSPSEKLASCRGTARMVRERTLLTKRPAAAEACRPALKLQLCVNAPPEQLETKSLNQTAGSGRGLPRCALGFSIATKAFVAFSCASHWSELCVRCRLVWGAARVP